jgi:YVTN family beta-propeller protein
MSHDPLHHRIGNRIQSLLRTGVLAAFTSCAGMVSAEQHAFVTNRGDDTVSVVSLATGLVVATIPVGDNPRQILMAPDGARAYVVNLDSNSVSVIDTAALTVVTTIPVGSAPEGIAISRDGQRLYVSNSGSNSISIINRATNAVEDTISMGNLRPYALACHPLRDELWVGFGTMPTVMAVYSTVDLHDPPLASLTDNARFYSSDLVFTPDGRYLYAAENCGHCGRFHLLSGEHSNGLIRVIWKDLFYNNEGSATGLAVNPVTGFAYMSKQGQNGTPRVHEFTPRSVDFSARPLDLAVTGDGSRLYVVNDADQASFVSVVDTAKMETVDAIDVGNSPWGVGISTSQGRFLVSNRGDDSVPVVSLATGAVVTSIPVGDNPRKIRMAPDGARAYVVNLDSNSVSVIDTAALTVVETIPVGTAPGGIAISRDGQRLYVSNSGSNSISVINRVTNAVVGTISTGDWRPYALACHPLRDELWVGFGTMPIVMAVYSTNELAQPPLATLTDNTRFYSSELEFTSDGRYLYAAENCGFCGRFHLLSGEHSNGLIRVIWKDLFYNNEGSATGLAVNPVTGFAYMSKQGQNGTPRVHEFTPRSVDFSVRPLGLAVTADGSRLYVVNDGDANSFVSVVDTAKMETVDTINVGNSPWDIAITPAQACTFAELYPGLDASGDANGNALSNYYDYAAGIDPRVADSSTGIKITISGGTAFLEYTRRTNGCDIHSRLERSSNLVDWTLMQEGIDYQLHQSAALGPDREKRTLQLMPAPGASPRVFWRQIVSSVP